MLLSTLHPQILACMQSFIYVSPSVSPTLFLKSSLEDLNFGAKKPKLVEYLISKAIDHKPLHCEMTSVLLSDMYSRLLHSDDIIGGFDDLLGKLSDLVLDAPPI